MKTKRTKKKTVTARGIVNKGMEVKKRLRKTTTHEPHEHEHGPGRLFRVKTQNTVLLPEILNRSQCVSRRRSQHMCSYLLPFE